MSDLKEELTADNPELAKVGNEQLTAAAGGGSPGYKIIRLSYMDYTLQFLHPKPVTCPLCGEPVFRNETLDEDCFRCMHCKVMFVGYTNSERDKKGDIQLNLNKEEVLKRYNLQSPLLPEIRFFKSASVKIRIVFSANEIISEQQSIRRPVFPSSALLFYNGHRLNGQGTDHWSRSPLFLLRISCFVCFMDLFPNNAVFPFDQKVCAVDLWVNTDAEGFVPSCLKEHCISGGKILSFFRRRWSENAAGISEAPSIMRMHLGKDSRKRMPKEKDPLNDESPEAEDFSSADVF